MKKSTLCFLRRENDILLGLKKRGFGEGKWNGFGGKVEEGESVVAAACRETQEESGVHIEEKDMELAAIIRFYMGGDPAFECSIFLTKEWSGQPVETEEMRPHWFAIDALPYPQMWADDPHWLPLILSGTRFVGDVYLDKPGVVVEKFEWQEKAFAS